MKRDEEIDKIVAHLKDVYVNAENRDYRYNIEAVLRMAIAWADANPASYNKGTLVMQCTNLTQEQMEALRKPMKIVMIEKPKQDCVIKELNGVGCLSCDLYVNCKKRGNTKCEDYQPLQIVKIEDI